MKWILSMDKRGLAPRSDTVRQMANLLLQKRSTLNQGNLPEIGQLWVEEDIYNFDERGFRREVVSTAKVITGAERSRKPVSMQPGNREWATVIDCTASCGWSLFLRAKSISQPDISIHSYLETGILDSVRMARHRMY